MNPFDIAADGLPDDRVTCGQCRHADTRKNHCKAFNSSTIATLPRRCIKFAPHPGAADKRTGEERYPDIVRQILDLREFEKVQSR